MRSRRTIPLARRLRKTMTPPEVLLWLKLRAFRPDGPRFRRQHPFGPYVLDFYCPAIRLAVEVDGYVHGTGDVPERDERRDAWLAEKGVRVLRISASDVTADPDEEADMIWRTATALLLANG